MINITTEVHDVKQDGVTIGLLHIKKTPEMSQELHQKLEEAFDWGVDMGAVYADAEPGEEPELPSFDTEEENEAFDLGFDVGHTNTSLDD